MASFARPGQLTKVSIQSLLFVAKESRADGYQGVFVDTPPVPKLSFGLERVLFK